MPAYADTILIGWFYLKEAEQLRPVLLLIHGVISGCYFTRTAGTWANCGLATSSAYATIGFGAVMGRVLDWLGRDYCYTFAAGELALVALAINVLGLCPFQKPDDDPTSATPIKQEP